MGFYKQTDGSQKAAQMKKSVKKGTPNKKADGIVFGDMIVVQNSVTKEKVKFKVTDTKNPFIGKRLRDVVSLKGENFSVYMINGEQF